jgi:hypothetical protein
VKDLNIPARPRENNAVGSNVTSRGSQTNITPNIINNTQNYAGELFWLSEELYSLNSFLQKTLINALNI